MLIVLSWKSKGLSAESIKPPDNSLTPALSYYDHFKVRVKFTGSCLKQPKISYTHEKVVNIYIVYLPLIIVILHQTIVYLMQLL